MALEGSARSAKVFLNEGPRFEVSEPRVATSSGIKIKALQADYDNHELRLTKDVVISGSEGTVYADAVTLMDICEGSCKQIQLRDNVRLEGQSGAYLVSDQGDIDLVEGNAVFRANGPKTLHCSHILDGIPSQLESRRLKVLFTGALNQLKISEVIAEDSVIITREKQWQAKADAVSYTKHAHGAVTTLFTTDQSHECVVMTPEGDTLYAKQIVSDDAKSELTFYYAHGQLSWGDKNVITFAAKEAHWNNASRVLTLLGGAMLEDAAGHIENDEQVTIHLGTAENARELHKIEARGYTSVTMKPKDAAVAQRLSSHGVVIVDHATHKAHFLSPVDAKGKVPRKQQVCFTEGAAELHTDTMHVDYCVDAGALKPMVIVAEGDVCLKGHLGGDTSSLGGSYALCDRWISTPKPINVLLSSKHGRVALLDRSNGIAISSPAVRITRDLATGKEVVKGLGDVRFSLLDREYEWIKDRFNIDLE